MTKATNTTGTILALDVGERRIGLALARAGVGLAQPLTTLLNDKEIFTALQQILKDNTVTTLVVGYPRNQDGEATAQTQYVETFVGKLRQYIDLPIEWQDESLTSVKAEAELDQRGKPFNKSEVDALAATYILEDFIAEREVLA